MIIRTSKNTTESFVKNVGFMFIVYWGILVLWQNISNAELRGMADMLIKVGLLTYFVIFYLAKAKTLNTNAFVVMVLGLSLMITAGSESRLSLNSLIAYIYPVLMLLMVYGVGDRLEMNRSHLITFCNCVIGITLYAALYALVFCWDQFAGAFSAEYAYGNELSSFFISNFEYGMYLLAAVISCFLCLSLTPNLTQKKKTMYIAAGLLFLINLILTFSRTTILGLGAFLLAFMLWGRGTSKKWVVTSAVAVGIVLLVFPDVRVFITDVVFKNNNMAGRDVLFEEGLRYYQNGSAFERLFGHGVTEIQLYFENYWDHGNVHNSYLQVFLQYGAIGGISLIIFMLSQLGVYVKMIRKDRYMGAILLGLSLAAMLIMFTTTAIVFGSSIDSFFMTVFFILVPKYVRNSINAGTFYDK